ncbi:MAG: NAD(P)-binding domain-containing protein [Terracidiphilus sp.]|jgi:hypothetical protein
MKIGVLGSGKVAITLADGFLKHGYEVMVGSRTPGKLAEWNAKNPKASTGTFNAAAAFGNLIVLVVKGSVASDVLQLAGAENLKGKTIIDVCNPFAGEPSANGVFPLFTNANESLMERLQTEYEGARFVKAFNSVGYAVMDNPKFKDGKPTMFICGNNQAAKDTVRGILDQFGWETADMGTAEAARAIEPLAVLWCIHGFTRNQWTHAFKLLIH